MHINEIQSFNLYHEQELTTFLYQIWKNRQTVVQIWAFQDCNVKPSPLINMHDIMTQHNRAHLQTMSYRCTINDLHPVCHSGDIRVYKLYFENLHYAPPTTNINDIQHFYMMNMQTLANNMFIPNIIENGQTVFEIWAFPNCYIKPRPLIHMHDIITNNNRAHLRTVGYLSTTYDINQMCCSGDFVFTSSTWQNNIKPRPLRILIIFNVFIAWSCGH